MKPTPTLCAGLDSAHLNAVCQRRQECARYANWWEVRGVQFNLCNPTGQAFKHFTPLQPLGATPQPARIGETMDLFA